MATARDRYRRLAERYRAWPANYGLRHRRVFVNVATHEAEQFRDDAGYTQTELLEAGAPPRIKELSDEELALGSHSAGTVRVGPFTPRHASGGVTREQLVPTVMEGSQVFYTLMDEDGSVGRYALAELSQDRALRFTLTLERTSEAQ